jgi:hypothetical protein
MAGPRYDARGGGFMASADPAAKWFRCSDRERAAFEAGIKLGSIYHQYVGVPVNEDSVGALEAAIEAGVRVQPFVEDVRVRIDRSVFRRRRGPYKYYSLRGEMLDVSLRVRYGDVVAEARLSYVKELRYPLMRIDSLEG